MIDRKSVLLGAGNVFIASGALTMIGSEAEKFGKKVLVVAGTKTWKNLEKPVVASFFGSGCQFEYMHFSGYCTDSTACKIAEQARLFSAEVIVGIGGGSCVDASKWAANKLDIPCITVPSVASTCASTVPLCVIYDDTGSCLGPSFIKGEVPTVIIDTDVIANAPERLLASGIIDALAKRPEVYFSLKNEVDIEKNILFSMGYAVSEFTWKALIEQGPAAIESVKRKKSDKNLEEVICLSIILTGLVSNLASGGKQLALAHAMYDCVTTLFKSQRKNFFHGEIVGCGIPAQMQLNGREKEEINAFKSYATSIGAPVCFADLGINFTESNLDSIIDYLSRHLHITDKELIKTIRKCLIDQC
ncbi:iron-containing alcohol dehydrogenase family protein [Clostridium sp.]|uniref:iron-containing alcohol dehydrogenase family protein n=1 Tax=Clostridium sp. TaxID=1506 RepID=UPI001A499E5F|nr:iron-containing alcohol dehydrogenase family protein [Clostridium sp.]MBK5242945.1 iron-containing alcohol dehydrogenase family protein [Clostridium sp.]